VFRINASYAWDLALARLPFNNPAVPELYIVNVLASCDSEQFLTATLRFGRGSDTRSLLWRYERMRGAVHFRRQR